MSERSCLPTEQSVKIVSVKTVIRTVPVRPLAFYSVRPLAFGYYLLCASSRLPLTSALRLPQYQSSLSLSRRLSETDPLRGSRATKGTFRWEPAPWPRETVSSSPTGIQRGFFPATPQPEENVAVTVIWKMENTAGPAVWRIVLKIHAETMHGCAPHSSSACLPCRKVWRRFPSLTGKLAILVLDHNFISSDFGTEIHKIGAPPVLVRTTRRSPDDFGTTRRHVEKFGDGPSSGVAACTTLALGSEPENCSRAI